MRVFKSWINFFNRFASSQKPRLTITVLLSFSLFTNVYGQESQVVHFSNAQVPSIEKVDLSAHWFIPARANGATVIALHGCGGLYSNKRGNQSKLSARHQGMAELLTAAGYHVLFVDSFTPRGQSSICTINFADRKITTNTRRQDVQAALKWLSTQKNLDANRVALLGWSNGGSTVLNSINANNRDGNQSAVDSTIALMPKLAVAFYPGCTPYAKLGAAYQLNIPLLILIGEKDDWTPAEACVKWEQAMATKNLSVHVYPDAYHDFDSPDTPLKHRADVPNGVHPGQGVTTGGNPEARAAAYQTLMTFLAKNL